MVQVLLIYYPRPEEVIGIVYVSCFLKSGILGMDLGFFGMKTRFEKIWKKSELMDLS